MFYGGFGDGEDLAVENRVEGAEVCGPELRTAFALTSPPLGWALLPATPKTGLLNLPQLD